MAELIVLTATLLAAGDGAYVRCHLPVAATLVGVSVAGTNAVGTPTDGFVAITEPELDEVCAVMIGQEVVWDNAWRSRHLGGTETPVPLPADTALGVTLYLNGGATPTLDLTVALWLAL